MSMSFSASIKLNKVYQLLAPGRWFSMVNPVSFISETDIAEILFKVALKLLTIKNQTKRKKYFIEYHLMVTSTGNNTGKHFGTMLH